MDNSALINTFWPDRGFSFVDNAVFLVAQALVSRFAPPLIELAGRFSLRTRISFSVSVTAAISIAAVYWGISPYLSLGAFVFFTLILIHYILADLTSLGIINAFRSTRKGVGAEDSLKLVKSHFDFLGVGAKKLSDLGEFRAAMKKAKSANKKIRLLLSDPNNKALLELAKQNGKDQYAYSSRVRDSIRQLLHLNSSTDGGVLEIKLYDLASDFSMPHFRLMFVDGRLCIFSHVVWNDKEGDDNPQLLIRNKAIKGMAEASLYNAYYKYFQDLWDSANASVIDDIDDPRIAV